jgi:hypothetical protein
MTLETSLETRGCERLLREGAMPLKRGQDGEPDREVLWGRNLHLWIEFKKAKTGRVRVMQKIYAKYLRAIGDDVYFVDTYEQLVDIIETHIMCWGRPTARRDKAFNPGFTP